MEGLPQNPDALGAAAILLWLALAAVFLVRSRRRQALVVSGVAAVALAAFPYVVWRDAHDIQYTSGLDPWLANHYGVSVFRVHPAIFDNAALHMPLHARYYLAADPRIDTTRRAAFDQWAVSWLLPRRAVASPARAQFVLSLGVRPSSVGVRIARSWKVMPALEGTPAAYLGKVER